MQDKIPKVTIKDLQPTEGEEPLGYWARHRFLLLIIATIVISLVLVSISLAAYNLSGTAQLDLSRPGYQSVSGQVETEDRIDGFSPFGSVSLDTVDEFISLYDEQAEKAKAVDAFNGDPLNPEVLEFTSPEDQ